MRRRRVGVLISGRGSNMAALVRACEQADFPAEIVCVISNRADAAGLEFAKAHHIPTEVLLPKDYPSRQAYDAALDACLHKYQVEIVACAGFMRILSADLVSAWAGRMINIHPSLLPAYKGLDTHGRALRDGANQHGCTVHYVTAELDGGPVIAQAAVPVLQDDTEESLAARVLVEEHRLYPQALAEVCAKF